MVLDSRSFTAFERVAHDRIAGSYAEHFAPLTSLSVRTLLDATAVQVGQRVLDVATGPGLAAGAAQARGATAIGIDVSPGMVALAQRAHPATEFRVADVLALPFPDGHFDAVMCNFGLGHFPEPEAALTECVRVLVEGGMLAFTWWDQPVRQRVQGLFRETITELALAPPPDVPQGHDTLRFSDADAFAGLLRGGGLDGVQIVAHGTVYPIADVETLWRAGIGGMAVTAAAIASQDAATQARARESIARRAEIYRTPRGLEIPIAYLIGHGRKDAPHKDHS